MACHYEPARALRLTPSPPQAGPGRATTRARHRRRRPPPGMRVTLHRLATPLCARRDAVTNGDGRCDARCSSRVHDRPLPPRVRLATTRALRASRCPIHRSSTRWQLDFGVADAAAHYHVRSSSPVERLVDLSRLLPFSDGSLRARLGPARHPLGASHHRHRVDRRVVLPSSSSTTACCRRRPRPDADAGVGGELWAVHGGGFHPCRNTKVARPRPVAAALVPGGRRTGRGCRGSHCSCCLYYAHAGLYLVDRSVADLVPWRAIAISLISSSAGWLFYDQLCKRLGLHREKARGRDGRVLTLVSYALSHLFAGRALFHPGGRDDGAPSWRGTCSFVIMPAQRKPVAVERAGRRRTRCTASAATALGAQQLPHAAGAVSHRSATTTR